ncbi:MMPL family transporter [Staphylococcus delphini]|uniref:MMPL family transporter n=1 Tax=Staphylococcus delphini TaxID=53344 RepID=UPI001F4E7174|nr:MMPL family transporter [Staphylococcus delphini]
MSEEGNIVSKWLYKFGKWIAEHRWLGILGWLMALIIIVTPLIINAHKFQSDLTMNGLKSLDTNDKINEAFHQDSEKASMRIVFHTNKDDGINDKGLKSDIEKALTNIEHQDDDIQHVSSPYETKQINDEKNTAIADINYVVPQTDLKEQSKETVQKEIDDLKEKHNIQIETTDRMTANPEVGGAFELIGIVVAFVVSRESRDF